ncbi:MAG TPA: ABC transporter substrate-binding protein [Rhodopila sp.]|uniref:ABC transporter substrate-binding protein n=1 Tax=Rhodopila sp. TaxID=2480087 RepID=UPI002BC751EE|nr:ABC transporter substrate-binding protein [Rhodopila sp.]HVY15391.1 ABC transporter substrate-binding protein [Rhodopila sp.]
MLRRRTVLLAAPAIVASSSLGAAETVKVGVMFPLTGNSAASGQEAKAAVEVATDIINSGHPDLKGLTVGTSPGLPGLHGAKLDPLYVDHRGDPSMAQALAQKMITNDRVAALFGAYQSSCAMTATAVGERYGVPFVVADSVAANITGRGFKYTFRVTPIATNFADNYMQFLHDQVKAGRKVTDVAVVNENTDYGSSVGDAIAAEAVKQGFPVSIRIPYSANGPDVTAQVLQLKQKNPSVALFVSYASDAILFMRTMKTLDYLPPMIVGDSSGFSDPSFLPAVGAISQGLVNRSVWSKGAPGSLSYGVNAIYQAKTGHELDDVSGRVMQAFFVLADALNRAASTDPKKVQAALKATNMPKSAMFVGYKGVRFDDTGQNVESATYLTQLQGKDYVTVWPDDAAAAKVSWPMKGWR